MQTLIFDLGGVLLYWNPQHLYAPFFNSRAEIDQFPLDLKMLEAVTMDKKKNKVEVNDVKPLIWW